MEGFFEYGTTSGAYSHKTRTFTLPAGNPVETVFEDLQANTAYFYRLQCRKPGEAAFQARPECRFHTQRAAGSTFTFAIQGDSHPERPQMSDPNLYARTLLNAASGKPDFYICMGDDFSVDTLQTVNADTLPDATPCSGRSSDWSPNPRRSFCSTAITNRRRCSISTKRTSATMSPSGPKMPATAIFPTPAPDGFYTGDTEPLKSIGLLKDYYAWTWGDALFVVLDNYWHSPAHVDNGFHEEEPAAATRADGSKDRDWWGITLGDAQYQWFKRTLEQSKAKYKFVFAHHVLGSGRGGIDECDLCEWGGRNKRGDWEFASGGPAGNCPCINSWSSTASRFSSRATTISSARQERDGIVYQEVPMPADQGYVAYNEDRYQSGREAAQLRDICASPFRPNR